MYVELTRDGEVLCRIQVDEETIAAWGWDREDDVESIMTHAKDDWIWDEIESECIDEELCDTKITNEELDNAALKLSEWAKE